MKRLLCLAFILVCAFVSAESQKYDISPPLSSLTFDVSAQVHQVHGTSNAFSGTITGDPADITTASITVSLDPSTFDTQDKARDQVMREKSLETDKYPAVAFVSKAVEATSKQLEPDKPLSATIKGTLKLHGMDKEMSVPVTITLHENQITAEGDMALKLDDWNIFRPRVVLFKLQNDIKIHFKVGGIKR
ncbi:MAG TPA: YceI family protein [Acidobacteriota bacterium]|nr:YceI family protein [Acidobacteriota bacterium]